MAIAAVSEPAETGIDKLFATAMTGGFPPELGLPDRPDDGHKGDVRPGRGRRGLTGYTGAAYPLGDGSGPRRGGLRPAAGGRDDLPHPGHQVHRGRRDPDAWVAPGVLGHAGIDQVLRWCTQATACIIGPGLGRDYSTRRLVVDLVQQVRVPTVVDADGLNALSEQRKLLTRLPPTLVLTPHPAEMSRLCGLSVAEVQADREGVARRFAGEWKQVVVLKAPGTVIAAPDGRLHVNSYRSSALASAGTAMSCLASSAASWPRASTPYEAAVTGVYSYGAAAEEAASRMGEAGVLASDPAPGARRGAPPARRAGGRPAPVTLGQGQLTRWAEVDLGAIRQNAAALRRAIPPAGASLRRGQGGCIWPWRRPSRRCRRCGGRGLAGGGHRRGAGAGHRGHRRPHSVLGPTPPAMVPAAADAGSGCVCTSAPSSRPRRRPAPPPAGWRGFTSGRHRHDPPRLRPRGEAVEPARPVAGREGVELEAFGPTSPRRTRSGRREPMSSSGSSWPRFGPAPGRHPPRHAALLQLRGPCFTPDARLDMVRCGLPLYGYASGPGETVEAELVPALTWKALRWPCTTSQRAPRVGYGGTFTRPHQCASPRSPSATATATSAASPTAARSSEGHEGFRRWPRQHGLHYCVTQAT